jgi:hypothetical protein
VDVLVELDVTLAAWRETLTHTETLSSALRLTVAERERAEDFVRDLQRTHR